MKLSELTSTFDALPDFLTTDGFSVSVEDGRLRLQNLPESYRWNWNDATAYETGDLVWHDADGEQWWIAQDGNTNSEPAADNDDWAVDPDGDTYGQSLAGSAYAYTFANDYISVETDLAVPSWPDPYLGYSTVFSIADEGGDNFAGIAVDDTGQITFLIQSGLDSHSDSVEFDAAEMKWWRIRERAGTLYFDTSVDTSEWTTRYSHSHGASSSTLWGLAFHSDTDQGAPQFFDNLNTYVEPLVLSAAAQEFYDQLEPAIEGDEAEVADLVSAFAKPFERAYDLANGGPEGFSPWALIFDADDAPDWALPFLANFAGVPVIEGQSAVDLREAIRNRPQLDRGTPAAIKAALMPYLTGLKQVFLYERTPSEYEYTIYSLASETPDEAKALAAMKRAKPARLIMHYDAIGGPTWAMIDTHYTTWASIDSAYETWDDLASDESIVS